MKRATRLEDIRAGQERLRVALARRRARRLDDGLKTNTLHASADCKAHYGRGAGRAVRLTTT